MNGLELKAELRRLRNQLSILESQTQGLVFAYPKEDKTDPVQHILEMDRIEKKIAAAQKMQSIYNNKVEVDGLPLVWYIKRIGGLRRRIKRFKDLLSVKVGGTRWGDVYPESKSTDELHQRLNFSRDDAMHELEVAEEELTRLSAAIARGNTVEVDLT